MPWPTTVVIVPHRPVVTAISHIRDGLNWPVVGQLRQAPPVTVEHSIISGSKNRKLSRPFLRIACFNGNQHN